MFHRFVGTTPGCVIEPLRGSKKRNRTKFSRRTLEPKGEREKGEKGENEKVVIPLCPISPFSKCLLVLANADSMAYLFTTLHVNRILEFHFSNFKGENV
jgi:hypothetical protein